ncbi:MAG: hypothetical protein KKF12_05470 [Proteobacteria bacterium]|nr:hypothetical protein [Desulfobacula sp.]MBU3953597.1 hypothetical protein [Pseudomonadota bacterium]MBU4130249.1 hypothetical protein [Pseudomonadota bacterium]
MNLSQIKINGIRLNSGLVQAFQQTDTRDASPPIPLYQGLARDRTNISCLGLRTDGFKTCIFCCHDPKSQGQPEDPDQDGTRILDVCTVSVYPHHSSLNTLGFLMGLFGEKKMAFRQMVSSNAMISFVVKADQKRVLAVLEQAFELPCTHTPFHQNFNDETAAFVKKRYSETRATYVEEKIKTYGFQMESGLEMLEIPCDPTQPAQLSVCGKSLQSLAAGGKKFYFTCAMATANNSGRLFCLTDPLTPQDRKAFVSQVKATGSSDDSRFSMVDLIGFHGPHFGDRFGIFNTAMACLTAASIPVLLAGCTGASICMVLPATFGEHALPALAEGFETP